MLLKRRSGHGEWRTGNGKRETENGKRENKKWKQNRECVMKLLTGIRFKLGFVSINYFPVPHFRINILFKLSYCKKNLTCETHDEKLHQYASNWRCDLCNCLLICPLFCSVCLFFNQKKKTKLNERERNGVRERVYSWTWLEKSYSLSVSWLQLNLNLIHCKSPTWDIHALGTVSGYLLKVITFTD